MVAATVTFPLPHVEHATTVNFSWERMRLRPCTDEAPNWHRDTRKKSLSQQKTRPIAYVQWHLDSAVLLAVSCIDRMNGIDGNEMNLASQSANSGRLQNPLSFYIESDRFEDFWASDWFEGILEAPDLRNHEKRYKNDWILTFVTKSLCFLMFSDTYVKNVVISLDVCKKCSVTWLELLKKRVNSYGFLAFLKWP